MVTDFKDVRVQLDCVIKVDMDAGIDYDHAVWAEMGDFFTDLYNGEQESSFPENYERLKNFWKQSIV